MGLHESAGAKTAQAQMLELALTHPQMGDKVPSMNSRKELAVEKNTSIEKVLEFAIEREKAAHRFYMNLSGRMSDPAVREAITFLAKEEMKHREFLERYLRGEVQEGILQPAYVVDYRIVEHMTEESAPRGSLSPEQAFLVAAKREKTSHEFYRDLGKIHPLGPVRDLFEKMSLEELRHKEKVEYLYANTAFPQTSGG